MAAKLRRRSSSEVGPTSLCGNSAGCSTGWVLAHYRYVILACTVDVHCSASRLRWSRDCGLLHWTTYDTAYFVQAAVAILAWCDLPLLDALLMDVGRGPGSSETAPRVYRPSIRRELLPSMLLTHLDPFVPIHGSYFKEARREALSDAASAKSRWPQSVASSGGGGLSRSSTPETLR